MSSYRDFDRMLDARLLADLARWNRQRKLDDAADDASLQGATILHVERGGDGHEIVRLELNDGRALRARSDDSGNAWFEFDD